MKIKQFVLITALTMTAWLLPTQSQAYGVTDSSITKLSDTLTMYTLTVEFGFLNADMWMPITASQTISSEGNKTNSLLLSTSTIQDEKYLVPMKEKGQFTLLVLESHEVGKSMKTVRVNQLPVTIQREGKKPVVRIFKGDELKDFVFK